MSTIKNLKITAASVLLAVAAAACGTTTASSDSARDEPKRIEAPARTPGHIEPPRVVDGLDLVRQAIVE